VRAQSKPLVKGIPELIFKVDNFLLKLSTRVEPRVHTALVPRQKMPKDESFFISFLHFQKLTN